MRVRSVRLREPPSRTTAAWIWPGSLISTLKLLRFDEPQHIANRCDETLARHLSLARPLFQPLLPVGQGLGTLPAGVHVLQGDDPLLLLVRAVEKSDGD